MHSRSRYEDVAPILHEVQHEVEPQHHKLKADCTTRPEDCAADVALSDDGDLWLCGSSSKPQAAWGELGEVGSSALPFQILGAGTKAQLHPGATRPRTPRL